jgi:glycosyltransferase involved in cell wall biosynthesis
MRIGLVTPYPPQGGADVPQSGEAWYSKKLAKAMSAAGHQVLVFGNQIQGKPTRQTDGAVEIDRCWDFGPRVWRQLFSVLRHESKNLDVVHIQYAVFLYGGVISALSFPFFLAFLKLAGVPVVLTLHQTVPLNNIDRNFQNETGIRGNMVLLKNGLHQLIRLALSLSSSTIVHESYFRTVLARDYHGQREKIAVVPLGMDEAQRTMDKELARNILGIHPGRVVVLFFGYLARYKGLENLIDAFVGMTDNRCQLVIAGGEHPRLKGKADYAAYLAELYKKAEPAKGRIMFTGFVPEPDVPMIFSAADVVVFPYTRAISASLPLAMSAAYQKPFLASESLGPIIGEPDILFPNTGDGLRAKILQFVEDKRLVQKAQAYSQTMLRERQWSQIAHKTLSLYRSLLPVPAATPARAGAYIVLDNMAAPPSRLFQIDQYGFPVERGRSYPAMKGNAHGPTQGATFDIAG